MDKSIVSAFFDSRCRLACEKLQKGLRCTVAVSDRIEVKWPRNESQC